MWILYSILASILQTFRNSFQRGLMASAGVWAATWVRFAFGAPITLIVLLLIISFSHPYGGIASPKVFWISVFVGGLTQVLATAALLKAMHSSSFAIGSTLQHTSLLIAAIFGVVALGDHLAKQAWIGMFIATIGLVFATWPKSSGGQENWSKSLMGGFWGLVSGICFSVSVNSARAGTLAIEHQANFYSSTLAVFSVQTAQAIGLGIYLYFFHRAQFNMALKSWRESLSAGGAGASASIIWFLALAMVPAALAKSVNLLVEAPVSILMGYIKFKERPSLVKIAAITLIVMGVIMTVLAPKIA